MAYFRCTTGGSGKGNTLVVTCADDLAGATITCTNGTKTYNKTCPSTTPYEVTFYGLEAGTWTVSATVSGSTYTATVVITDYEAELGGFSWRAWVDLSKNYASSDFTDLDDLLSDETAIRELMSIHACVDYLAGIAAESADVETIISNDLCAKWINNRDYALDTLYANTIIKGYMDTANKYFYGEWVNNNGTWGPKGNVPIMTANNAPYGEAIGEISNGQKYMPFNGVRTLDGADCRMALYGYVGYKFTNPVSVRALDFLNAKNEIYSKASDFDLIYSDDGTNWSTANAYTNIPDETLQRLKSSDKGYHLYWAIQAKNTNNEAGTSGVFRCHALQFYGRELSVSVPTMTSNTAPYGVASSSASGHDDNIPWWCFDNSDSTTWNAGLTTNAYIQYNFNANTKVLMFAYKGYAAGNTVNAYSFGGVNNSTVTALKSGNFANSGDVQVLTVNNYNGSYKAFRLTCTSTYGGQNVNAKMVQFFGLDYSEKEFEEGTTKKWLYDHGVELEPLYSAIGTSAVAENTGNEMYVKATVQSNGGVLFTNNAIDITNYSLLRIVIGKEASGLSTENGHPNFGISSNKVMAFTSISYKQIIGADLPNNLAIDVSSINQTAHPYLSSGGAISTTNMATATEFWLE